VDLGWWLDWNLYLGMLKGWRLTVPSQREKGSPLSRAKAKVCREVEAIELIVIMMSKISITTTMIVAPVVELVAV
jgi:hypothetical protein